MTVDHWPTPDNSTLEAAARAYLFAKDPGWADVDNGYIEGALSEVMAEPGFQATVAAVWAGRNPTPDAAQVVAVPEVMRLADVIRAWADETDFGRLVFNQEVEDLAMRIIATFTGSPESEAAALAAGEICRPGMPMPCGDAHTAGQCFRPAAGDHVEMNG